MPSPRTDVHAHFIPDFYRDALASAGHTRPDGIKAIPEWNENQAIKVMDDLGIVSQILSISSPGIHFGDAHQAAGLARAVNEEGARLAAAYPGRFGFFASLPAPDVDSSVAELRHALDVLHADGVVMQTHHHGVYQGDSRFEEIYAELHRRGAVLFIHPTSPSCDTDHSLGYPRPMLEFMFETTRSLTNMVLSGALERYPGMRVIVPHAGAALPVLANRIELLLPLLTAPGGAKPPSVREALRGLYFDVAGAPVPELLGALLQVADPANVLYGSDWPFTPAGACAELAERLDDTPVMSQELRDDVYRLNAARLFPRFGRPDSAPGAVVGP
ncbi:amidohydrolase family protein [Streptomyces sp. NPDC020801]|uniref:amidohydrolase family protein n=1 Tax=unclassified Streptomyces TaxID=2593676 RepID=UPI00378872AB